MSNFQNDSIFWIEVEKIKPNPFQPRKEFNENKLNYLAESIRQYGVLQPLVVTRQEVEKPDGGLMAEYELIAGERRLRASKIAGLSQVPAIIRTEAEDEGVKLELAIIENLQREDLNPIDRATAFQRLVDEFGLKHTEIGKKMGKSREYVSNSLRLLTLPEEMRNAISSTQITEGHARPLMMLRDKPEEQVTLFKEIIYKKLTVRDAEAIAKKVAYDKVRRKTLPPDPEMMELEGQLTESLGTRVQIERKEVGGKLTIDFFSNEDLKKILELVHTNEKKSPTEMLDNYIQSNGITQDSQSVQFNSEANKTPQASVEEEVVNRPMTEITDTATDEIDEEIQEEIKDEVEIVERASSQVDSNQDQLASQTAEVNNNVNIEQELKSKEDKPVSLDEEVEGISSVPNNNLQKNIQINDSVEVIGQKEQKNSDFEAGENIEMIKGNSFEKTDIESMTSTYEVLDNQNPNTLTKEENSLKEKEQKIDEEDDLYSVKDFTV